MTEQQEVQYEQTKEESIVELKKVIIDWMNVDAEISMINAELKDKKSNKKKYKLQIIELMKKIEVEALQLNGGNILIYNSKVEKKPLNNKILENILKNFFDAKSDVNVDVSELTKFVMENKEDKINETLKMKINK